MNPGRQSKRTGTTLSLCMIVKNEERFLSGCLQSVQGLVHDVVVVDTGSTDRTPEIARSFGAAVYHHPWENDFSRHRNQSIQYAKGDWILWLDADEAIEPGAGEKIRDAWGCDGVDSLLVTMVCYFGNRTRESWNNALKLFKNHVGIHFEGAVHNQVVGVQNTTFCPVRVYHYGYDLDQQAVKRKFERTGTLLMKAIQEEPDNFRHHHDLAVAYASMRMFRKAADEGLKAITLYKKSGNKDPNILWTYFVTASSHFNLGRKKEARDFAQAALRISPQHLDSHFVLASVCADQKDRRGFEEAYRKCVSLIEEFRRNPESLSGLVMNKMSERWRLELDYGALLLGEGDERGAVEAFSRGIEETPDRHVALRLVIQACRGAGSLELVETYIKRATEEGMAPEEASFERAVLKKSSGLYSEYLSLLEDLLRSPNLSSPDLLAGVGTEALKAARYKEAETLLSRAVDAAYETPGVFTALALACKYQGKPDEAMQWNLRALEMDEMDLNASVNLGHLHYDGKRWESARSSYEKALAINGDLPDVHFRLSLIALIDQDLPRCIEHCGRLTELMGISMDKEIGSIMDLSDLYHLIGNAFLAAGSRSLHREATGFARSLQGRE